MTGTSTRIVRVDKAARSTSYRGLQTGFVLAMAASAFGPYLTGSVRAEQATVYAITLMILPKVSLMRPPAEARMIYLGMFGALVLAIFGTLFPPAQIGQFERGSTLAGLDNFALPVAVMTVVWCVVSAGFAATVFSRFARLVALFVAGNGILAIVSTRTDLSASLRPFWAQADASGKLTVADLAAQLGRFSGIFNQPAEAGLMYSIGALFAVYCFRGSQTKTLLVLTPIALGGLIAVSKVFILCGLPLTLIYLFRSQHIAKSARLLFGLPFVIIAVAQSGYVATWSGSAFFLRLLSPTTGQSAFQFYSANRYDSGSGINVIGAELLKRSPISGVGAAGWKIPFDSGWVEVLVVAGLLGVALHFLVFIGFYLLARQTRDRERAQLTRYLTLAIFGAYLGLPALTANRDATIIWIAIALLALAATNDRIPVRIVGNGGMALVHSETDASGNELVSRRSRLGWASIQRRC